MPQHNRLIYLKILQSDNINQISTSTNMSDNDTEKNLLDQLQIKRQEGLHIINNMSADDDNIDKYFPSMMERFPIIKQKKVEAQIIIKQNSQLLIENKRLHFEVQNKAVQNKKLITINKNLSNELKGEKQEKSQLKNWLEDKEKQSVDLLNINLKLVAELKEQKYKNIKLQSNNKLKESQNEKLRINIQNLQVCLNELNQQRKKDQNQILKLYEQNLKIKRNISSIGSISISNIKKRKDSSVPSTESKKDAKMAEIHQMISNIKLLKEEELENVLQGLDLGASQ